jgi:putative sterol carrier protein
VTIKTPADVWLKISRGELNGATAFMTGKFKVSGKMDLLMKMAKFFTPPAKS